MVAAISGLPGGVRGSVAISAEVAGCYGDSIDAMADGENTAPRSWIKPSFAEFGSKHHAASVPRDMLRRAAVALRECTSNDIFRLARVALEAAIRSEADLVELLSPDAIAMSALPQRTDVVSPTGYVG